MSFMPDGISFLLQHVALQGKTNKAVLLYIKNSILYTHKETRLCFAFRICSFDGRVNSTSLILNEERCFMAFIRVSKD